MGPTRMPVRGLTPLLALLAIAPPRVCTCDHAHAEPAPLAVPADDHGDNGPGHSHQPGPCDDPDCPCVKPVQLEPATRAATVMAPAPPAPVAAAVLPEPDGSTDQSPAPVARRTGDPPLYLMHRALRC